LNLFRKQAIHFITSKIKGILLGYCGGFPDSAGYLVREQLTGFDFPNDAVGETYDVSGSVAFNAEGEVVTGESSIVVAFNRIFGIDSEQFHKELLKL